MKNIILLKKANKKEKLLRNIANKNVLAKVD